MGLLRSDPRLHRIALFWGAALLALIVCLPGQTRAEEKPLHIRIEKAVQDGVAFLRARQQKDGSFGALTGGFHYDGSKHIGESYREGIAGFVLYALLKSGVAPRDPAIRKGFRFLDKRQHRALTPYDLSAMILALEALHNPIKRENARLALERARAATRGRILEEDAPIVLPQKEKKKMQLWINRLMERRQPSAWRYATEPGTRHPSLLYHQDLSSTQLALLALMAASRCKGIRFNRDILIGVVDFCLDQQEKTGLPHSIPVLRRDGKPDGDKTVCIGHARGFSYNVKSPRKDEKRVTGSMTTAGCANLLILKSLLRNHEVYQGSYARKVDRAIRDGIAWLDLHWTLTENPFNQRYLHYYLYGLERIGDLRNLPRIGNHLWYEEGAEALLEDQKYAGVWERRDLISANRVICTAFALLFLDRSTRPVVLTRAGK